MEKCSKFIFNDIFDNNKYRLQQKMLSQKFVENKPFFETK